MSRIGHVFLSSGREDVDVRTLGRGRPFVIEFRQPSRIIYEQQEFFEIQNVSFDFSLLTIDWKRFSIGNQFSNKRYSSSRFTTSDKVKVVQKIQTNKNMLILFCFEEKKVIKSKKAKKKKPNVTKLSVIRTHKSIKVNSMINLAQFQIRLLSNKKLLFEFYIGRRQ